ncbi:MAG: energy transducer TonB [Candidatus Thiodiazotropha sp. (ex Gloverina cf. vestifex)]|nr:energy transducer TonB [Candidatus Thiodiazotropha sp. (ex Gloverina cf. vestifex)]
MIGKDFSWRLAAVVVSLLIHLLVAFKWSDRNLISAAEIERDQKPLFVQLNFPQPESESVMPVVEPPPPVVKKQPAPKPKPKPKPKLKPQPMPVVEPPKVEEVVEEVVAAAPTPPPPANRQLESVRNEYLAKLMAQIEKNKFYPTIARRRHLQGMIRVSFRLGCDGKLDKLDVKGKHNLLRKAAGKAVEASLPLPSIPPEIKCPMLVDYAMAYTLEK